MPEQQTTPTAPFEASFSVLLTSIASSALISMGLAPNPQSHQVQKDRAMAKFNIDLLNLLKDKTIGNLTNDESRFLDSLIHDLQMKFVQMKGE